MKQIKHAVALGLVLAGQPVLAETDIEVAAQFVISRLDLVEYNADLDGLDFEIYWSIGEINFARDGFWAWKEDGYFGVVADDSFFGTMESGIFLVDPAELSIPVRVEEADPDFPGLVTITLECQASDCFRVSQKMMTDLSGPWQPNLEQFVAMQRERADREENVWWVEDMQTALRIAAALDFMLEEAGARALPF